MSRSALQQRPNLCCCGCGEKVVTPLRPTDWKLIFDGKTISLDPSLKTEKKHFIDTIKLIAYRAESALAGEIREALARDDDDRALLRRLFVTPANLRPDLVAQTLTVELHRLGSPLQDRAVAHLCEFLTASETLFPTTNLRLIFRQIGSS
jgi:Family of unknown function (DUF6527)